MRSALVLCLAATLPLALATPARADDGKPVVPAEPFTHDESPYALRLDVDIAVLVLGATLWGGTSLIGSTTQAPFCGGSATPPCDSSGINALDRLALNHSSTSARTAADVLSFIPIAYLGIDMFDVGPRHWKTYLTDLWVVAEALAWNGAIQDIVRRAVRRPRPFLYTAGVYPDERDSSDAELFVLLGTHVVRLRARHVGELHVHAAPSAQQVAVRGVAGADGHRVDRAGVARLLGRSLPDRRHRRRRGRLGGRPLFSRGSPPPEIDSQDRDGMRLVPVVGPNQTLLTVVGGF